MTIIKTANTQPMTALLKTCNLCSYPYSMPNRFICKMIKYDCIPIIIQYKQY